MLQILFHNVQIQAIVSYLRFFLVLDLGSANSMHPMLQCVLLASSDMVLLPTHLSHSNVLYGLQILKVERRPGTAT